MRGRVASLSVLPNTMDQPVDLIVRLMQLAPNCLVVLILMIGAWYAARVFRANLAKTELKPVDYLESFQKMREEGKLTEEEFRIIRELVSLQINRSPDKSESGYSLLNKSFPRSR